MACSRVNCTFLSYNSKERTRCEHKIRSEDALTPQMIVEKMGCEGVNEITLSCDGD